MTEKERMQAELLYDANYDEALAKERLRCKDLCHQYNLLPPSQTERQAGLMRQILGRTDGPFAILAPFWCDYGYNIEIGKEFFANHNCVILDAAKVSFGDHVFIAPDCGFYTAGHPIDAARRNQGLEYAYPIRVGSNVWIGGGVRVLPGVTIGDGAVIGSGSVVNRDIPAGVVAAGNPCRVLRPITEQDRQRYTKRER